MQDAAFAIFGEMIDEIDLMEANAKQGSQVIKILVPGSYDGLEPAHLLCQHGLNRLMATPTEWHYNIDRSV